MKFVYISLTIIDRTSSFSIAINITSENNRRQNHIVTMIDEFYYYCYNFLTVSIQLQGRRKMLDKFERF